jgi:hypothetical protein
MDMFFKRIGATDHVHEHAKRIKEYKEEHNHLNNRIIALQIAMQREEDNDFFKKFDHFQIYMSVIAKEFELPRALRQLILDAGCTVRRAAVNPTVVYEYVTTRDYKVHTNIACNKCAAPLMLDHYSYRQSCECNPNDRVMFAECVECKHVLNEIKICKVQDVSEDETDGYKCENKICLKCGTRSFSDYNILSHTTVFYGQLDGIARFRDSSFYIPFEENTSTRKTFIACNTCLELIKNASL